MIPPAAAPHGPDAPAPWVRRFASLIAPGGAALDLACGRGRHTRFLLAAGHPVTAVDIALAGVADLADRTGFEAVQADLEGGAWPLPGRHFAGIVVTNYLWRPLFPLILDALAPNGVLIYETFARGNGRFGKPPNPDFLLAPGELLALVRDRLHVVAFEQGIVDRPRPAAIQRLAAINRPDDPDESTCLPPALPGS